MRYGRFSNYPGERHNRTVWHAIRSFGKLLFARAQRIPTRLKSWVSPLGNPHPLDFSSLSPEIEIIWVGHSTFLIRAGGKTILTDPIFDSISYFLNFKRLTKPGIAIDLLPKIDAVVISHNHPDHMDEPTLHYLKEHHNPHIFVPFGDKEWFVRRQFERVSECTWWDNHQLSNELGITFLPAVHWSQRGLFDHNRSLWGSWMIETSHSHGKQHVYFAGDSAYGTHFKTIAQRYSSIDVVLMPIGPSEPRELLRCSHVDAEEAGQSFLDLGAKSLVPMHWGAYRLGTECPMEPIERLQSWWKNMASRLKGRNLWNLKMGERKVVPLPVSSEQGEKPKTIITDPSLLDQTINMHQIDAHLRR